MTNQNRRDFLRKTAATTTAASLLASSRFVHAQDAAAGTTKSPNSQMSVAIVGVGGRGGSHISAMLEADGVNITHICDIDAGAGDRRGKLIEEKQGKRPIFETDLRRVLDDKSIDMVTIATPNHWHALAGIWAMQAGKDTYIEKPVCHNIAEGTALIAASRKYDKMCQVGTQCRSSQAIIEAFKFMNEGGIGEVKFARGLCYKRRKSIGALGDYAIPSNVDFNLWSGPAQYTDPRLTRERFHYDWHWQRQYGNGDLGNQGPHQTDIARWGLGIDTHPTSIISYGGRLGYQAEKKDPNYVDAGDTANTEVTLYNYGDKSIVFETRGLSVDNSADTEINRLFDSTSGNKIGVIFYGTKGYIVQREYSYCVAMDKDFNQIRDFKGGGDHFGNFIDACRRRDRNVLNADVREGHLSAGMSHLGNISYYMGENNHASVDELQAAVDGIKSLDDNAATLERTVKHLTDNGVDLEKYPISLGPHLEFDPEAEKFTNLEAANPWLTREYRDDFVCPTAENV
ncbi:Gfo/Idh/MocA family protein [Aureliella helgolandensis]|uniref:Inositol 2-dehydrogenase n=1 Tax=Aureliella helgolandensis TaxID=2527968 RepID=A0A518GEG0_9BACT|nr:Gfo/Idh/MocA family oxidoreductase [Aureliella helgolandensis]QDV26985.1 Inositol 2-dehydrogenase [Aureliella helgolandensis]